MIKGAVITEDRAVETASTQRQGHGTAVSLRLIPNMLIIAILNDSW
jgi:hypothetical protein